MCRIALPNSGAPCQGRPPRSRADEAAVALEELVELGTGDAAFEAKAAPLHFRLGDLHETARSVKPRRCVVLVRNR